MQPVINETDIVEVSLCERYHIGDIVLVMVQDRLLVHRIVAKDQKGYVTKGDHSYMTDRRNNSRILGKAMVNWSQKTSLTSKRIQPVLRAKISNANGKTYRRYLKASKGVFRKLLFSLYKMGDLLLFHI